MGGSADLDELVQHRTVIPQAMFAALAVQCEGLVGICLLFAGCQQAAVGDSSRHYVTSLHLFKDLPDVHVSTRSWRHGVS